MPAISSFTITLKTQSSTESNITFDEIVHTLTACAVLTIALIVSAAAAQTIFADFLIPDMHTSLRLCDQSMVATQRY